MSYPLPPEILVIDFNPPYFLTASPLYEKSGTPFEEIPTCPIGVGVFTLLVLGLRGILLRYL